MSTRDILQTKLLNWTIASKQEVLKTSYNLPKDELSNIINECDFIIKSWEINKYREIIIRKINLCIINNPEVIADKALIEKFCKIDRWYEVFKKQEVKIQTILDEEKNYTYKNLFRLN